MTELNQPVICKDRATWRIPHKPPLEQNIELCQMFPHLDLYSVPESVGARKMEFGERWIITPRWRRVGRTYSLALQAVLEQIDRVWHGHVYNDHRETFEPKRYRLHKSASEALAKIENEQKQDVLYLPVRLDDFEFPYQSAKKVRENMPEGQFGLDPFSVGIILLSHREYFLYAPETWILCSGGEYDRNGLGKFAHTACFIIAGGTVHFTDYLEDASVGRPSEHMTSPVGLVA